MANNFLYEQKPGVQQSDTYSFYSKQSKMSENSKIKQNIDDVGKYDPYKIRLQQDRLGEKEKARLEALLSEIDDNLDELMKEKAEYYRQGLKVDSKS